MTQRFRTTIPTSTIILAVGVVAGVLLGGDRTPTLIAGGGDRSGDSIVTTGPVTIGYDEGMKVQIPQEAVYLLDYRGGRLVATIPSFRQGSGAPSLINTFAERDLVADFKLDLETGPKPHFLMTTGGLGAYSKGNAPLYVIETATDQLAVYQLQSYSIGRDSRPKFELIEVRSYARSEGAGQPK
jgi:hypothetical protein